MREDLLIEEEEEHGGEDKWGVHDSTQGENPGSQPKKKNVFKFQSIIFTDILFIIDGL